MYSDPFVIGTTASCIVKIVYSIFSKCRDFLGSYIHKRCIQSLHTWRKGFNCRSVLSTLD